MSVQSQIERINLAVQAAYSSIIEMGGTVPVNRTVEGLSDAIKTIPKDKRFYFPIETSGGDD